MEKISDHKKILNSNEIKFLKLLAKGICVRHISEKFGLSEYQAYKMFRSIKIKLNTQNKPHSVYVAVKRGIL